MKVILTQDVPSLGVSGVVKDVAKGYARNYLIPRGLAVVATPGAIREYEQRRDAEARRDAKMAEKAEALAERLSGLSLTFVAKAGEKGRLYGSITPDEIAEALGREVGVKFDRRKHIVAEPIREIGVHIVPVRITANIIPEITVVVEPADGEPAG